MIFYHGSKSPKFLNKVRQISQIFDHGFEFTPSNFTVRNDERFILDNGAFTSDFDEKKWTTCMDKLLDSPLNPDFVILPDVWNSPAKTWKRHLKYVGEVRERGYDHYVVAQKGDVPWNLVRKAKELDAEGIFVGGSWSWKNRTTSEIVDLAHLNGLKVHIGMPKNYLWAYRTGADSMDSTNISRNKNYGKIQEIEDEIKTQQSITDFG